MRTGQDIIMLLIWSISPSGFTLLSTHSFIGASGDGRNHEPWNHGVNKGVLESVHFPSNNTAVHCMAPKQIAIEHPSFFIQVYEDTICLQWTHSHYMHVQWVMDVKGDDWCHFVLWTEGGLFVEEILLDDHPLKDTRLLKLSMFYRDKWDPETLLQN